MTYVKTYLSNVTSGFSPVTTGGSPLAGKVNLEAFCLPQGGFEYINTSNKQKQRVVKSQMELGEIKLEMLSWHCHPTLPFCPDFLSSI